jgi:hypothetical protein
MLKRILLSGVALTFCAGMAVAQTAAPDQSTPPAASPSGSADTMSAPGAATAPSASENQSADASLFSNLKGASVVGTDNKAVGRLADILLDDQGNIRQIVIGSGGVAGVGETLHAYDQASLPALNSDGKVQLGLTTASLESLPEYTYPEKVSTGRASTDATGTPGATTSPPAADSGAASTDAAPTNDAADAAGADSAMGASRQAWPASYLVGANIANAQDSADIGDLHFADNKVDKVVISHGGTLGVGTKQMEVAFNDLKISGDATDPKVELQGDALQQLNAAAEQEKAKKDLSPPAK